MTSTVRFDLAHMFVSSPSNSSPAIAVVIKSGPSYGESRRRVVTDSDDVRQKNACCSKLIRALRTYREIIYGSNEIFRDAVYNQAEMQVEKAKKKKKKVTQYNLKSHVREFLLAIEDEQ